MSNCEILRSELVYPTRSEPQARPTGLVTDSKTSATVNKNLHSIAGCNPAWHIENT
jgi:hypothetical protein